LIEVKYKAMMLLTGNQNSQLTFDEFLLGIKMMLTGQGPIIPSLPPNPSKKKNIMVDELPDLPFNQGDRVKYVKEKVAGSDDMIGTVETVNWKFKQSGELRPFHIQFDGELHWYGPKSIEEKIVRIRNPDEFEVGDTVSHPERGLGEVKLIDYNHCPDGFDKEGNPRPPKPLLVRFKDHKAEDGEDNKAEEHWYAADAVRNKIRYHKIPENEAKVGTRVEHLERGKGTVVAIDESCVVLDKKTGKEETKPFHVRYDKNKDVHRYSWKSALKIKLLPIVEDFEEDNRVQHKEKGRGTVLMIKPDHINSKKQFAPLCIEFDGDFNCLSEAQAASKLRMLEKGEDKRPPHVTHRKGTEDDRRLTRVQKMAAREKRHKALRLDAQQKEKHKTSAMEKAAREEEKEIKDAEKKAKKEKKKNAARKMALVKARKLKPKKHLLALKELKQFTEEFDAEKFAKEMLEKQPKQELEDRGMDGPSDGDSEVYSSFSENSDDDSEGLTDNSDDGSDAGTIMSQMTDDLTESSEASSDEWDEDWDGVLAIS